MRVDVAFSPADLAHQDLGGRTVFVIDVLRATSTICAALHHGALAVIPFATPDAARQAAVEAPGGILAGEQDCVRIPGFDLGNSPREMTPRAVRGRVVRLSTSNGSGLLLRAAAVAEVHVLAAVNFSVTVSRAQAWLEESGELLVLCAGRDGRFGLDDAYTAGRFLRSVLAGRMRGRGLTDAALAAVQLARLHGNRWDRVLRLSAAGRRLIGLGLGEDVRISSRQDEFPVAAMMRDGRVVAAT